MARVAFDRGVERVLENDAEDGNRGSDDGHGALGNCPYDGVVRFICGC
jgi:hypothetical protein